MNQPVSSEQSSGQGAKYVWPFISIIIAAIWLVVVYWVHAAVGGVGTGLLFSIMAWLVGAPGVIGIGLVCTAIVMFALIGNVLDETVTDTRYILWSLACWVASIVIGVVWPIVVVLKGAAQVVAA